MSWFLLHTVKNKIECHTLVFRILNTFTNQGAVLFSLLYLKFLMISLCIMVFLKSCNRLFQALFSECDCYKNGFLQHMLLHIAQ